MRSFLRVLARSHNLLLSPCPYHTHPVFHFTPRSLARVSSKLPDTRKPTNEKIPYSFVRVVDPETDKLSPTKQSLSALLSSLDLKKWIVELVSEKPEPIVRVIDRREAFQKYKEQRKAMKKGLKSGEAPKEIQLTWGTASGDISHKLAKARSHLEKGCKVDVVFAPRKGQGLPSPKERHARANEVALALEDIAKEWKAREVTPAMTIMFFQGKSDS
ncbi:hypothetical protein ID866_6007 [Astraeus odoratus]|nr:hypothetical protein ID866_6007 [Astraeus odoratus]